jgi:hypothetical protein
MRLLGTFLVLLVVGSGALTVASENLAQGGDNKGPDAIIVLAASAIAAISFTLLGRIVYRVSQSSWAEGS